MSSALLMVSCAAAGESLMPKMVSANLPLVMTYEISPWDALGDGTRRAIFERLVERPRAVGELAGELAVTRPTVSQHLRVLKAAGWSSIGRKELVVSMRSTRTASNDCAAIST